VKVNELKALIKDFPDEMVIVMSSDGEGNSFSPLSDFSTGTYVPTTTWFGDFHSKPSPKDDLEDIEYYEAMTSDPNAAPALVFWPVN
jgi:hypothetical protein